MSLNSAERGAGGGGGGAGAERAPRLQGGADYAAWRPRMDAFLQAKGAEDVHRRTVTQTDWEARAKRVEQWADEDLARALADADGSSSSSGTAALTAEQKAGRALVRQTVDRSQRAYGHLYPALPDELQLQVAHLPRGWAYGLWAWLEAKFQSTEDDNIATLFMDWTALAQDKQESYDAYRARVNRVQTLLTRAKEEPSPRMYAFTLLDRLQPHYKAAVLALKSSALLKDPKKVDWDEVTRFINAHERSELRLDGAGAEGQPGADRALAATQQQQQRSAGAIGAGASSRGGGASSGGWQQARGRRGGRPQRQARVAGGGGHSGSDSDHSPRCYECGKIGHIGRDCPLRRSARGAPAGARTQSPTSSDGADERANVATRWFSVSSWVCACGLESVCTHSVCA